LDVIDRMTFIQHMHCLDKFWVILILFHLTAICVQLLGCRSAECRWGRKHASAPPSCAAEGKRGGKRILRLFEVFLKKVNKKLPFDSPGLFVDIYCAHRGVPPRKYLFLRLLRFLPFIMLGPQMIMCSEIMLIIHSHIVSAQYYY